MRIARVSATGARIEADRAQRGRDLGLKPELREALARGRLHNLPRGGGRLRGGPVERACLADAKAEMARARGRSGAKAGAGAKPSAQSGAKPRGKEWMRAALQWDAIGSRWLIAEVRGLAERGRLELGPDGAGASTDGPEPDADRFGLTTRERQVLGLLAEGATNRQIGAALFMAEKTASVHVSRILTKLGVQGRTQAAAVAHRMHLA